MSNTADVVTVTCVFTSLAGTEGFQMAFKNFAEGNGDNTTAGEYHSAGNYFSPNGSGTATVPPPTGVPIRVTMTYVRSQSKVYFTAQNMATDAVFVNGTASGVTWYPSTHAHVRNFYKPMVVRSFTISNVPSIYDDAVWYSSVQPLNRPRMGYQTGAPWVVFYEETARLAGVPSGQTSAYIRRQYYGQDWTWIGNSGYTNTDTDQHGSGWNNTSPSHSIWTPANIQRARQEFLGYLTSLGLSYR